MADANQRLDEWCRKHGRNGVINILFESAIDRELSVGFHGLNVGEQTLVCVWQLLGEVYNGGLMQYFGNPYSEHASAVPAALKRIGADEVLAVVEKAFAHFPQSLVPADYDERQEQVDQIVEERGDVFEALTDEFYDVVGNYDDTVLERKLFDYIRLYPQYFPELA